MDRKARPPRPPTPKIAANGALALITVPRSLLHRQLEAQAAAFKKEGGFAERLRRQRSGSRRQPGD